MRWEAYDPRWLVKLAEEQHPDRPWLANALARCTRCHWERRKYVYFVDPSRPNQPGSAWQFESNLSLEAARGGPLILDILTGQRVGGVELLKRL